MLACGPMKGLKDFPKLKFRPLILSGGLLILLFLQACSTYSSSRGYPGRNYSYQTHSSAYHPGHGYYDDRYYGHSYYGSYQPGWFISAGSPGAYEAWGYAPLGYWPSYSHAYYRHSYYPYYDPWYSYSRHYGYGHYRNPYGYRYGHGSGYRYGNSYGHPYGNWPYHRNTHSYRPPGQHQPAENRPDPVVIPPSERGRRGASGEFNQRVDEGLRQREIHQAGRRSATVVNEEQGLSRSTGLAPTQAGDQGMTISNRNDRKVRASRLEPVGAQIITLQPNGAQNGEQSAYSTQPAQRSAPTAGIPIDSRRSSRGYQSPRETLRTSPAAQDRSALRHGAAPVAVPPMRNEPVYRQAPAGQEPPTQQPYQQQSPAYQQRLDSSNVIPRADRRQQRDTEEERERQNH